MLNCMWAVLALGLGTCEFKMNSVWLFISDWSTSLRRLISSSSKTDGFLKRKIELFFAIENNGKKRNQLTSIKTQHECESLARLSSLRVNLKNRLSTFESVLMNGILFSKQYVSKMVCDIRSFGLSVSATVKILLGSLFKTG